jgi:hypothetical protein
MILIKLIRNLVLVMHLSMFMTSTVIMMVNPPTVSATADVTAAVTDASKTKVHVGALRKVRLTNETMIDDDDLSSSNITTTRDRCRTCDNTPLGKRLGFQIYYTGITIGGNCLERCVYSSTLWAWKLRGWVCGECPNI